MNFSWQLQRIKDTGQETRRHRREKSWRKSLIGNFRCFFSNAWNDDWQVNARDHWKRRQADAIVDGIDFNCYRNFSPSKFCLSRKKKHFSDRRARKKTWRNDFGGRPRRNGREIGEIRAQLLSTSVYFFFFLVFEFFLSSCVCAPFVCVSQSPMILIFQILN